MYAACFQHTKNIFPVISITELSDISDQNMNPFVWGPPFWFVMHTVSLNYPQKPTYAQRRTHYDFFYNIRNILPCEMCRQHYRTLLKRFPIEPFLDSRDTLVSWVILIHNQVNVRLGKPTMSKYVVMQKYSKAYERQSFCQAPGVPNDTLGPTGDDVFGSSLPVSATLKQNEKSHELPMSTAYWKWIVGIIVFALLLVVSAWVYRNRKQFDATA